MRNDTAMLVTHLGIFVLLKTFYGAFFLGLIAANILSNVREMGEHGNNGKAVWVNVQPGLLGVLFFSNLGFWYHGIHHANPGIHYLELPARARDQAFRHRRDFIYRKGYGLYFFSGTSGDIKFEEESKIESQTKKRSSVGR